jgi:dephospho-CoA kinase
MLVDHGALLIDADVLARRAVDRWSPGLRAITERWGPGVLTPDGSLDRAALRRIVFGNRNELEALNAIVHPEVERLRVEMLRDAEARGAEVVVCDIPLLFEAKLDQQVDRILLVDAPEETRLTRLVQIRKISRDEAQAMMAAQMPSAEKKGRAHIVIENAGTLDELRHRVDEVWISLLQSARGTV